MGPHMMPIIELRPHYNVAGTWEPGVGGGGEVTVITTGEMTIGQTQGAIVRHNEFHNPPSANADVTLTIRNFLDGSDIDGFGRPPARIQIQAWPDQRGYTGDDQPIPPFENPDDLIDIVLNDGDTEFGPPCGSMQPWELATTIGKDFWNANFIPGKYISFFYTVPSQEEAPVCFNGEWVELKFSIPADSTFEFVPNLNAPATLQWVTTVKVPHASNGFFRYIFAEQRFDPVTGTYVTVMRSNGKVFYGGLGTGISGSSVSQTRIEYRPTIVRYETNASCAQE